VRKMFRWAARVDGGGRLVPMTVYHELCEVEGLEEGRCDAAEGEGQGPVDLALVEKTLPFLSPTVQAMVRLHYHMGCRSQDLVAMRPRHIDRAADSTGKGYWLYRSPVKKTAHRDRKGPKKDREARRLCYWIKPEMQELLTPLIVKAGGFDSDNYVFTTRRIRALCGELRGRYTTSSYRRHVVRACDRLFPAPPPLGRQPVRRRHGKWKKVVRRLETDRERLARLTPEQRVKLLAWQEEHRWTPYQLRHARLTEIARRATLAGHSGAQASRRVAQHKKIDTTLVYVEENLAETHRIFELFG